jgi:hypothetical protein
MSLRACTTDDDNNDYEYDDYDDGNKNDKNIHIYIHDP